MYQIKKKFGPYPFAHRQHKHNGHCSFVHGHNWYFEVILEGDELDDVGFVYDFGKFKRFKHWLEYMFDHTLLINKDDPNIDDFIERNGELWDMREVDGGSSELIAKTVFEFLHALLNNTMDSDKLVSVRVIEDEKNSAIYERE